MDLRRPRRAEPLLRARLDNSRGRWWPKAIDMTQYTATPAQAPGGFDDFMNRMSGSGRTAVERHLTACEKDLNPDHIRLWKRFVGLLGRLTPDAPPMPAARAVRFYVPDGKYRLQVFAFEDLRDGMLAIYLNDARPHAVQVGVLAAGGAAGAPNLYAVGGGRSADERLLVEPLTAAGTSSAPDYYKHMLGWHRTAIRVTLGRNPTPAIVRAAEAMCMIAVALPASIGAPAAEASPFRSRAS